MVTLCSRLVVKVIQTSFLCFVAVALLQGQAPINILSLQQGLPKSQIYDIVQDSFGFIWLGTRDGLVKYDGQEMELFRKSNSKLPFNYCYDLFIDHSHRLWLASNADYGGAAYLDLTSGRFVHLHKVSHPKLANNGIVAINQNDESQMVLVTKDFHLNILHEQSGDIRSWNLSNYLPDQKSVVDVTDVFCDPFDRGSYWICCRAGLVKFNVAREELIEFLPADHWSPIKFFYDGLTKPYLWVTLGQKGGLLKINLKDASDRVYYSIDHKHGIKGILGSVDDPSFAVLSMARKSPIEIYVASQNRGIGIFNLQSEQFDFSQHHSVMLDGEAIRSVFSNERGELWIGADESGLSYLSQDITQLKVRLFPELSKTRSQFGLRSVVPLGGDRLLLTFNFHPEVWIWHRRNDTYRKVALPLSSPFAPIVGMPYQDEILLGINTGLYSFDTMTQTLEPIHLDGNHGSKNINLLQSDLDGFWFVNWGVGLGYLSDTLRLFESQGEHGLRHRWTHSISVGPDNEVWVGQQDGLYSIDKENFQITTHSHQEQLAGFGNPNFKALTFDQFDRLWTGNFGAGIYCFDIRNHEIIKKLDVSSGLPSDRIYDLITDDEGFIWTWTAAGLASFYPTEDLQNLNIRYYTDTKFLPVDRVGVWFYKLQSGEIFFGLSGGFAYFDPRSLRKTDESWIDPPIVTKVRIFDQTIPTILSSKHPAPIKLKPNENFISISFSAPRSGFVSKQEFNHKLSGVDQDWVSSGNNRTATYTDLDPGSYYFSTRVKTEHGVWSEASTPMTIELAAPWYLTDFAKVTWVLLTIGFLLGINRLIVARERMQNQLVLQQTEASNLRELDVAKSQFFTQISHEFRTPLTVILGLSKKIKDGIQDQAVLQRGMDAIERNGKLLLKHINQILDLSKLQSKSIKLDLKNGDVVGYLDYLLEPFVAYAQERAIEITHVKAQHEIPMDFDPEHLRDVFTNLISNALKFTAAGGEITVRSKALNADGQKYFELSLQDTGVGIEATELDKIFQPYYQVKDHAKSGTGLGLATTLQWVQAMAGQISVESKPGVGSIFKVVLPITNVADPFISSAYGSMVEPPSTSGTEWSSIEKKESKGIILVVEDNDDLVNYLRLCLEDFSLIRAADGDEGVRLALEHIPDLIISDVMMPKKDGYEVCADLKSDLLTNHIPIILLTAKATQGEKKQGLQVGADAYLTKPFDEEELLIRVNGLLSQRKILQQKYSKRSLLNVDMVKNDIDDAFLDRIEQYTLQKLSVDFTVEEMARDLQMSRIQLYRKVKALTGKSVSRYIRLIRLYQARTMLRSSQMNVNEICYAVGFSDPSYFSKVFKEAFGASPSALRTTNS